MSFKKITVFGGASSSLENRVYNEEAFRLGQIIADNNMTLVFGIGDRGMMGYVFQGVLRGAGSIRGITTKKLLELQCERPELFNPKEIEIVPDLSTRKFKMFDEGDVMVILPGGWGTLDELTEFSVLTQTGQISKKPMIFVNMHGFWDGLKKQIKRMIKDGALNRDKIDFVGFVKTVDQALPKAARVQKRLDALRKKRD